MGHNGSGKRTTNENGTNWKNYDKNRETLHKYGLYDWYGEESLTETKPKEFEKILKDYRSGFSDEEWEEETSTNRWYGEGTTWRNGTTVPPMSRRFAEMTNARSTNRKTTSGQTTTSSLSTSWTDKEKSQVKDLVSQINKLTNETSKYKPLDRRVTDNVHKRNALVDRLVTLAESKGFETNLKPGQVFRGSDNMKALAKFLDTKFDGM